jgi:dihydroorotase
MKLLIKNGNVFVGSTLTRVNLSIENGIISKISEDSIADDFDEVYDCEGLLVLPGVIDSHVHFRTPGSQHKEDFISGSKAAVAGGVATVIDMPNTNPPTITGDDVVEKKKLAQGALCNIGMFSLACEQSLSLDIDKICGRKMFLGSTTGNQVSNDLPLLADFLLSNKLPLVVHAEDENMIQWFGKLKGETNSHHQIRDGLCAEISVANLLLIARRLNAKLHIAHISTAEEVELIFLLKSAGVTCEVCPHHLFLNHRYFDENGNRFKMNPPLRDAADSSFLWNALDSGLIDTIGSDHAPHLLEEKDKDYKEAPSGVPGVQTLLPLMLNAVNENKLSLKRMVELVSENPARIFGLKNRGYIKEGFQADITVVDMGEKYTIKDEAQFSKCGWTPYHGFEVQGKPVKTFVNGVLKYDNGKFFDIPGEFVSYEE